MKTKIHIQMMMQAHEAQEYWYLIYFDMLLIEIDPVSIRIYKEELEYHLELWLIYGGGLQEMQELNLTLSL